MKLAGDTSLMIVTFTWSVSDIAVP